MIKAKIPHTVIEVNNRLQFNCYTAARNSSQSERSVPECT